MSAKNVWTRINPREINRALSPESLSMLEIMLERSSDDTPLKDDRYEKSQIYKMSVAYKLHEDSFRENILSYLKKQEVIELSEKLGIPISDKETMISNILDIPWDDNPKANTIAEFIDIPKFTLEVSSCGGKHIPEVVYPWILKYDLFLNPVNVNNLESEFANRSKFKTLKSFQSTVHQKILDKIFLNFGKCILNMPTGTGKTRTAMEAVCSFLLKYSQQSVVWVAHSTELLDQAALEFSQIWEFLGDREIKIVRHYGDKKQNIPNESSFIVTSFQTLIKNKSDFDEVAIGLVVVDEAHLTIAKKWKEGISNLIKPKYGTKVLGLTATPVRSYLDTKMLVEYYNNNLVQLEYKDVDKPVFEALIEEGILAKPKYRKLYGDEVILSDADLKKIKTKNIDYSNNFLKKLAKSGPRNLKIVKILKEILGKPEDKRQILFFGLNVEHSKLITTWLLKNNYSAFHLDSKAHSSTRKSCIEAFKKGNIRVLCNYGILSTGFDVPKIDCIFISRPTTSHVLHSQMIGRGLRGPKLGGTSSCLIVEVEDNIVNFSPDQRVSFEMYKELWNINPDNFME